MSQRYSYKNRIYNVLNDIIIINFFDPNEIKID